MEPDTRWLPQEVDMHTQRLPKCLAEGDDFRNTRGKWSERKEIQHSSGSWHQNHFKIKNLHSYSALQCPVRNLAGQEFHPAIHTFHKHMVGTRNTFRGVTINYCFKSYPHFCLRMRSASLGKRWKNNVIHSTIVLCFCTRPVEKQLWSWWWQTQHW